MRRLFAKGFLSRKRKGRTHLYSSTLASPTIDDQIASDLMAGFLLCVQCNHKELVPSLIRSLDAWDPRLLQDLRMELSKEKSGPPQQV